MKVVVWGHPLHQSTHGYVHSSYYKAFKHLGYDVEWVPNVEVNSEHYKDTLFFVEDSQKSNMPVRSDCKYITHHVDTEYFTNQGVQYENVLKLGNYLPREEVHEKIADLTYWDQSTRTVYQCWGTDLLPNEIDENDFVRFNPNNKYINYVAMLYEQGPWWAQEFANLVAEKYRVEFRVFTQNASDEENKNLIRSSFLCPDFRSDWHLECGYVPCRMFKNISYGRIPGTNSPLIKRALGDYVVFGGTPQTLYHNLLDAETNQKVNMKEAMIFVKENHTFINRIQNLMRFI